MREMLRFISRTIQIGMTFLLGRCAAGFVFESGVMHWVVAIPVFLLAFLLLAKWIGGGSEPSFHPTPQSDAKEIVAFVLALIVLSLIAPRLGLLEPTTSSDAKAATQPLEHPDKNQ